MTDLEVREPDLVEPTITPARELDAHDRCESCGAQAYVAVQFESKAENIEHPGELLFCKHHTEKYAQKLNEFIVVDERFKLDIKLDSSC